MGFDSMPNEVRSVATADTLQDGSTLFSQRQLRPKRYFISCSIEVFYDKIKDLQDFVLNGTQVTFIRIEIMEHTIVRGKLEQS